MNFNRRDFLKKSGLATLGLTGLGTFGKREKNGPYQFRKEHEQTFNMHNYAAPAIDLVRIGFIGVGSRGSGHVRRLRQIEGTEIRALCDIDESALNEVLEDFDQPVDTYTGSEDAWKELCERDDLDLIINAAPWHLHTPICLYAMENGKHTATEIPAAQSLEECWALVEASERTKKHCYIMENACYGEFEMVTLNMAREGYFGELIHAEGAYIHQLMRHNFTRGNYHNMWRFRENATRNGNLYPMHGLGSIAQSMEINYGDQMKYMVSVSSADFMMQKRTRELAESDPFFEDFVDNEFRGNMNTSIIKTFKGRTIMLQHDVTSPRPYSRIHLLSGTEGIAREYPEPRIANSHDGWLEQEEFDAVIEKYKPEIIKRVGEMARQMGGHGGMDTLMTWRLIDCLRNGIPLDMDVYDAASWSSVIPLSEWSVANEATPIHFPDFTSGAWRTNKPNMDIELERGGTTQFA
ncbi:MAG: Gfo/Idh/MocA family oxidoreductase [Balneolaceae bacterium]|nr:Gfo/Idh/MocA family oxidoreductase [Balneolaceae bacterium]